MNLSEKVRVVHDFPKQGIAFRDITTVLADAEAFRLSVDEIIRTLAGFDFDVVLGPESRGFIFGVPVSYSLRKGFVPVRKKGKLPHETICAAYDLEYGQAEIEIHADAIKPGQKAVVIDDLLATGGTCKAVAKLVEQLGGTIAAFSFFIELEGLGGRKMLEGYEVRSVLRY